MSSPTTASVESFINHLSHNKSLGTLSSSRPIQVATVHEDAIHASQDYGNGLPAQGLATSPVKINCRSFESATSLSTWFNDISQPRGLITFYAICQSYSWAPLNLCSASLRAILHAHDISPSALDFLTCMNRKTRNIESGYCTPVSVHESGTVVEYAYTVKYAELYDDPNDEPWRIRQSGIYHKYDRSTKRSVVLLFSPQADSLIEKQLLSALQAITSIKDTHAFQQTLDRRFMSARLSSWRSYIQCYEIRMQDMSTALVATRQEVRYSVSPALLDDIKTIEDALLPLQPIFSSLQLTLARPPSLQGQSVAVAHTTRDLCIPSVAYMHSHIEALVEDVNFLLKKQASFVQLLDKTLAFQHQQILLEDSATIRVITVITLVYLSFTMIGTAMSMPLFHLDQETSSLLVSKDIWIYFAVAVPLTAVSISYWRWTAWRRCRAEFAAHSSDKLEKGLPCH